jgi:hypothetical protein
MGVGKHMKTFFAAMTEQVGMGGYGPKIKMTPMGPFKWNDNIQLWENVNNGSTMNNISFQDMNMMDYDTLGGGNNGGGCNYNTAIISNFSAPIEESSGSIYTSTTETFTNTCPIVLISSAQDSNANNLSIEISTNNGGSYTPHTLGTTITMAALGNLTVKVSQGTAVIGNARFRFLNQTVSNNVIWGILASITPEPP